MKKIIFILLCLLPQATSIFAKEGKDFLFEPNMMHPQQFQSRIVDPGYYLRCLNDTIECHLPYMGVAYTAPVDGNGLVFRAPLQNWNEKEGKKGKKILTFETSKNAVENFRVQITLFKNGNADLRLRPSNAQSISYSGHIVFSREDATR